MKISSVLFKIEPDELKAALLSFVFVFILMASYYMMKPVRDALPSDWGDVSLAQQWTITFIVSTIAVSIYNFAASIFSLKRLVPAVFIFFAISFLAIFIDFKNGRSVLVLGKVYYVWSSVFSLFHISVFWSFVSQLYTKEESKRLFAFINTGASVGAIFGAWLVSQFSNSINEENILLIASGSLLLTLPLIHLLNKESAKRGKGAVTEVKLSPNPFSGFQEFITHKRLLGIASFIFVFTGVSAFLYSIQTDLLVDYSRTERKELLGRVELVTSLSTVLLGIFIANRLSLKFGLRISLGIVPLVVSLLLFLLSMNPAIMLVLVLQVVRRSGNYAITRPSREILFTAVDKEARFKTKPIIDVAIYRGGDVFWIWIIALLGDGWLHLGLTQLLYVGAAVSLLLAVIGYLLGKSHEIEEKTLLEP